VTCTTPAFVETVRERDGDASKLALLPNGADLRLFQPMPKRPDDRYRGKFVVMYSGLLGLKHGLKVLLEAANLLRNDPDVLFVLAGSGADEATLRKLASNYKLPNVLFAGELKVDQIPATLAQADVCVSMLDTNPYFRKIISVKVFEYMACGKPVIGMHSGETARILSESQAGIVVPPGDSEALAARIRELKDCPELLLDMGEKGLAYVADNYDRDLIASKLERLLVGVAAGRTPASIEDEETLRVQRAMLA
ncbi:MAG TPA: glycosyltransferase family 4 protein, partial [Fimbriimonas sp.]